ncbi:MAG: PilZ domain-containing protein [Deltaproteobacteria bacterium]
MKNPASERRQYIRLDSVFPVRFRVLGPGGETRSPWIQGFTHNVSRGGLQLDVETLDAEILTLLLQPGVRLALQIRMPLHRPPVAATAKIAWFKENGAENERYAAGLTYETVEPVGQKRIMRYVGVKRNVPLFAVAVFLFLMAAIAYDGYLNYVLIRSNKALVQQFIDILQESSVAKEKIKQISRDKENLQLKIGALEARISSLDDEKAKLGEKLKQEELKSDARVRDLNATIDKLGQEKAGFQDQLIVLQHRETAVTEQLLRLGEKKSTLEKQNFDKMYRWLAVHQNPRTGLVISFEGDNDLSNWAFIYDQSLALQVYLNFSDFDRARKVLDFFNKKAKRKDALFFNAYYASDGQPAEYIVHAGPNIWIGIGVCQYTFRTRDQKYLRLAEDIAGQIIALQKEDKDGGIRGGPDVEWYSTEHNLDAYAFFAMLHTLTGKQEYAQARDATLAWLVGHTYDKMDVPVARGRGDSTIATDTYAWSIASIGPRKLSELGMNPDKIVEFAEQNCVVEVPFTRMDGHTVQIKGFDFAPERHTARGGVVSSEWTAQMIVSLRMMGQFYRAQGMEAKAVSYEEKADDFLNGLCTMIISSPSPSGQGEGCLPYASTDFVDTGHGWTTPKGKLTGSVSGTAYAVFAYYHYNPLQLKE